MLTKVRRLLDERLNPQDKHGEHQPAVWRRGIGQSSLRLAEASFTLANSGQHVEQIAC